MTRPDLAADIARANGIAARRSGRRARTPIGPLIHRAVTLGAAPGSFLRDGANAPLAGFRGHLGPEAIEQAVAVAVLRSAALRFHAAMNGSRVAKAVAAEAKALGLEEGVPDILVYAPVGSHPRLGGPLVPGVALEFKAPDARPRRPGADPLDYAHVRPAQKVWLRGLRAIEWRAEVVYSAEDAIDVLRDEGLLPQPGETWE